MYSIYIQVIERDSSTITYIDPKGERDIYIQKLTKNWKYVTLNTPVAAYTS